MDDFDSLLRANPAPAPQTRLLWEAVVTCQPKQDLGIGPYGERFIVPIIGGLFRGAAGFETLSGTVLSGGADRQLLRADGVKELEAIYEMQVDDGTVLHIENRVTIDDPTPNGRYALSHVRITAPRGRWDWLNRRVFVGSMNSLPPDRGAVKINVWLVEPA
ncbi:DUF3237 domain-containing protein [Pararhodobacter zhoushanensis]|uniref:DUF3237 domain-containing protein n=1 Tax=Pararhodobacter zhoushanensis TaxID=2479545 RepID=UPI000F8E8A5D|nr:DUF3237 domain-containing protein [Pararhodobacter zhoushanensis]